MSVNFVDMKSATWGGVGGTRTNMESSNFSESSNLFKGTSASMFFPSIIEDGSEGGGEGGREGRERGRGNYGDIDDASPHTNAVNALNSEELVYQPDSSITSNGMSTPPRQPPSTSTLLKTPPRVKADQSENSPRLSPRQSPRLSPTNQLFKPPSQMDIIDPNTSMMNNPLKSMNIKHPPDSVQSPSSPKGQNTTSPKPIVETAASRRLSAAVAARQKAEEMNKNASQTIRPSSLAVLLPKGTEEKSV